MPSGRASDRPQNPFGSRMSTYRRNRVSGGTYFFTVVTQERRPLLCSGPVSAALREAIRETRMVWPFEIRAPVLLQDHSHCLWQLTEGDSDYPGRWNLMKCKTTRKLDMRHGSGASRESRRDGRLWQRRFWEHTIRDDHDLLR